MSKIYVVIYLFAILNQVYLISSFPFISPNTQCVSNGRMIGDEGVDFKCPRKSGPMSSGLKTTSKSFVSHFSTI